MKPKTFRESDEAVKYAHYCQQGGYSVALIIKPFSFFVVDEEHAHEFTEDGQHVEYFRASPAQRGVSAESGDA